MRGTSLNLAVLLTLVRSSAPTERQGFLRHEALLCMLLQTVVPRWHADSDWRRPSEEQQWCTKDIGFSGECFARKDCLCLCFDLHDKKLQASAAYFGEVISKLSYLSS